MPFSESLEDRGQRKGATEAWKDKCPVQGPGGILGVPAPCTVAEAGCWDAGEGPGCSDRCPSWDPTLSHALSHALSPALSPTLSLPRPPAPGLAGWLFQGTLGTELTSTPARDLMLSPHIAAEGTEAQGTSLGGGSMLQLQGSEAPSGMPLFIGHLLCAQSWGICSWGESLLRFVTIFIVTTSNSNQIKLTY